MTQSPPSDTADIPAVTYSIGEMAREFGITTRALRFYEDEGLLEPIRVGRRRLYRRRDRARLKLIMRGKRLGFTLAEIRETFELYDQVHGESKQLKQYLQVLDEKRRQLQQQAVDIQQAREELEHSYQRCKDLLQRQEGDKTAAGIAQDKARLL